MIAKISLIWFICKYSLEKYFLKNFKMFSPNVAGNSKQKGKHTIDNIKLIFPLISKLILKLRINQKIISSKDYHFKKKKNNKSIKIKELLNFYGSDKANYHDYHLIYSSIFKDETKVKKILEIGLGTDNTKLLSNMGKNGKPGASLRAFRDFFKIRKFMVLILIKTFYSKNIE